LTLSEVAKCALVCKHWSTVTRDPELWFRLFSSYYPHLSQFELSSCAFLPSIPQNNFLSVFSIGSPKGSQCLHSCMIGVRGSRREWTLKTRLRQSCLTWARTLSRSVPHSNRSCTVHNIYGMLQCSTQWWAVMVCRHIHPRLLISRIRTAQFVTVESLLVRSSTKELLDCALRTYDDSPTYLLNYALLPSCSPNPLSLFLMLSFVLHVL